MSSTTLKTNYSTVVVLLVALSFGAIGITWSLIPSELISLFPDETFCIRGARKLLLGTASGADLNYLFSWGGMAQFVTTQGLLLLSSALGMTWTDPFTLMWIVLWGRLVLCPKSSFTLQKHCI